MPAVTGCGRAQIPLAAGALDAAIEGNEDQMWF